MTHSLIAHLSSIRAEPSSSRLDQVAARQLRALVVDTLAGLAVGVTAVLALASV